MRRCCVAICARLITGSVSVLLPIHLPRVNCGRVRLGQETLSPSSGQAEAADSRERRLAATSSLPWRRPTDLGILACGVAADLGPQVRGSLRTAICPEWGSEPQSRPLCRYCFHSSLSSDSLATPPSSVASCFLLAQRHLVPNAINAIWRLTIVISSRVRAHKVPKRSVRAIPAVNDSC